MTRGHPEAVNVGVILVGHHKSLPGFENRVLGSVQSAPSIVGVRSPWRTVLIYLPNIVRTLGYPLHDEDIAIDSAILSQLNRPNELRELSRAISRIIAHEVVHAVSPDIPHTSEGLMCPVPTCITLLVGKIRFPPKYENKLRSDLIAALLTKKTLSTPITVDARSKH